MIEADAPDGSNKAKQSEPPRMQDEVHIRVFRMHCLWQANAHLTDGETYASELWRHGYSFFEHSWNAIVNYQFLSGCRSQIAFV